MKENIQEMEDLSDNTDNNTNSIKEFKGENEDGFDLLLDESNDLDDNEVYYPSFNYKYAKICLAKEFIFIFVLLLSPGLNFSLLYFPLVLLAIIYIFLFYQLGNCSKKFKKVIEFISLGYSAVLLGAKLFFIILIKRGHEYDNINNLLINLGLPFLLDTNSIFFMIISFFGESLVILISIISIIISHLYYEDIVYEDLIWNKRTKMNLFNILAKCIYFTYFMIVGFAIFNRSISTLIYISIMNIMLYLLSIDFDKFCLLRIFKIFSILLFLCTFFQSIVINVFNIYSVREHFLNEENNIDKNFTEYPKIINFWTKLGINQSFHENMPIIDVIEEYFGYFFSVGSTISFIFSFLKLNLESQFESRLSEFQEVPIIESDFYKFFKKNLLHPKFIIQICRIAAIFWLYFYQNFYSIGVIIWLFFGFLIQNVRSNKLVTNLFLSPMIIISLFCYHFSNIDGLFQDHKDSPYYIKFGLGKFEHKNIEYVVCNIFYFFTTLFTYSIFSHIFQNQEIKNNILIDNLDKIDLGDEEEEKKIKNEILEDANFEFKDEKVQKEIEDIYKTLNIRHILLKYIFLNIDKMTLIALYFVSVWTVNIIHFLFVIIFIIQLFFQKIMLKISFFVMIISQLLFFAEFMMYLFNTSFDAKDSIDIINLFIPFDTEKNSIEYFLYFITYCYYIQYQLYNSPFFQKITKDKHICLSMYIEIKLNEYPIFKKILFIIGNIIAQLYIWVLILIFVLVDYCFEISFIFLIKLILFVLIVYKLLTQIRNDKFYPHYKLTKFFVIFCTINTVAVYIFQLLCLEIFGITQKIDDSSNFFVKNLPALGFYRYKDTNLFWKFFPHFAANFLSILFLNETKRIIFGKISINNEIIKDQDTETKNQLIRIKTLRQKRRGSEIKEKSNELEKKNRESINTENLIVEDDISDDSNRSELKMSHDEEYEDNKNKMNKLDFEYTIFSIILMLTKFYWVCLFISISVIYSYFDLSFILIIYTIILGFTFIRIFYSSIRNLSNFIEEKSFYISRIMRYNLIETVSYKANNKKYKDIAFKYLYISSVTIICLFYMNAIFYVIQNGCPNSDCDKNFEKIFEKNVEDYINSVTYFLGFDVDLSKNHIFVSSWIHLVFGAYVCYDIYIEKIKVYFSDLCEKNRKMYNKLANQNIKLKALINKEKESVSSKLKSRLSNGIEERDDEDMDEINDILSEDEEIFTFDENENDNIKGEKLIKTLLKICKKCKATNIELPKNNKRHKIICVLKKVLEEIIIFVLLCTAITKLSIWSIIYMALVIYLLLTEKSTKKFYILYCFVIISIIIQSIIFVLNLNEYSDPDPNHAIIELINSFFNIPLYKNFIENKEYAFYFGFGNTNEQVSMIWIDFILVSIIYVYLDFFSYSIYQDKNIKGRSYDKISYYNLYTDKEFRNTAKKIDEKKYDRYKQCIEYNFEIEMMSYVNFKYYMEKGKNKFDGITNNDNNIINNNNNLILNNIQNSLNQNQNNQSDPRLFKDDEEDIDIPQTEKDNKFDINNLFDEEDKLDKVAKIKTEYRENEIKDEEVKSGNKKEIKNKENKCFYIFVEFLYLSTHNIILMIIIIISMMISGIISIFYIAFSMYFLITSSRIYTGKKYYYPKAIKKLLRIAILIDILLQILFQSPFIDTLKEDEEQEENNQTFYDILRILGLNKVLSFFSDGDELIPFIDVNQMVLIIGKAFIFLFMSLQLLVYSSRGFHEYYLKYLLLEDKKIKKKYINTFGCTNKRIEIMNESIEIRQKMHTDLDKLAKFLEKCDESMNSILPKKEEKSKYKTKNSSLIKENNKLYLSLVKANSDYTIEKVTKTKKVKNALKQTVQNNIIPDKSPLVIANKKYIEENEVMKEIKKLILDGFFVNLQIRFHKYSENYNSIYGTKGGTFERDIIRGQLSTQTYLEALLDKELKAIDLSRFEEKDMKYVVAFFDGTRKKNREKLKKENKKKKDLEKKLKKLKGKNEINNIELKKIKKKKFLNEEEKKIYKYLKSEKFRVLEEFTKKKLFAKYLQISYIIKSILKDLISFISNNFSWVCYFSMILNHMVNSSIISLAYPMSIFCYALLEYPRPPKIYWKICLIYTLSLLSIKFIINLNFLKEDERFYDFIRESDDYKLGLKLYQDTYSPEFCFYIFFDALVVISLLLNNYILQFKDLGQREQEIETIYEAYDRVINANNLEPKKIEINSFISNIKHNRKNAKKETKIKDNIIFKEIGHIKKGIKKHENEKDKNEMDKIDIKRKKTKSKDKKKNIPYRSYFQRLFPKIRNEKPGSEYYTYYTLSLTFIIIYILLFYTTMVQDKVFGKFSISTKQFSGTMVLFLLLHIFFLVYDRIIFINQNRKNVKYEYKIYHRKYEKEEAKEELLKKYPGLEKGELIFPEEEGEEKLMKKFNPIYIQKEDFNIPLFQKYILHMVTSVFCHLFIFFYLPIKGNLNLINKISCDENGPCNDFNSNISTVFFYFFYLAYLFYSGLQVKYGFYDTKRKSSLKSKTNFVYSILYTIYKNIPFLYEIKLGIDWTFTSTALDLFQWNKFESVYDILFTTKCSMTSVNTKLVGIPVGKTKKSLMGGLLSFVLIAALIIPLLIFSGLNPTNQSNNIVNANLKFELSFIYDNGVTKNFTIFQNSKPESIEEISDDDMIFYNYTNSSQTNKIEREQVQKVLFFDDSERNLEITRPQINEFMDLIYHRGNKNQKQYRADFDIKRIDLIMFYGFSRLLPPESQNPKKRHNYTLYDKYVNDTVLAQKLDDLENSLYHCYNTSVIYDNFYFPGIRLDAQNSPHILKDKNFFTKGPIEIGFIGCKNRTDQKNKTKINKDYLESYFTVKNLFHPEKKSGIIFHTFSEKVPSTTFSSSIFTFYLSFVLVLGNYVRKFFSGQPENIKLTEMPYNDELLKLCEGIKTSRYSFNFEEEERLYYLLIEIMRNPDYLCTITNSSLEQYNRRLELTENKKLNENVNI